MTVGKKQTGSKFYAASWWIVFAFFKVFFRLKVEGCENIPEEGGVILASNHASYLDPPTVGVSTRRELAFLAKRELFAYPIFKTLISKFNAIPINRSGVDRRALKAAIKALRGGRALLLFPEGTRRKDGRLGEGKAGVGMIALAEGNPIIPVYISGTRNVWRTLLGSGRVEVKFGKPIFPTGMGEDRRATYRHLSDRVMCEIGNLKNTT